MVQVYLLLGSNEGKREENMLKACQLIAARCGKIAIKSSLYETEAWGVKEQNSFLNQAIEITTELQPEALLTVLKQIEIEVGRVDTIKWGPRVIDIDILFYGDIVIDTPLLKVPHPFIQDRQFTLAPLNEICPELVHPVLRKSITKLLGECKDVSEVRVFNEA